MSHQTIVIREEDTTLRIDQVVVPSRITDKITLPVGGGPFAFCDENGGLLLTLDANGNIISEKGFFELSGQDAPAVSPAGKMRLYFDSGINKLLLSEDGGAYADIMDGAGNVTGPASAVDNQIVRFNGATGKLIQTANATIADDGSPTFSGTGFWTVNGLSGFGSSLRNAANQTWVLFDANTGVTIRGNSADTASALGLVVDTNTVLTTAGATLLEVWNGKFTVGTEVATIDKDGSLVLGGNITLPGVNPTSFIQGDQGKLAMDSSFGSVLSFGVVATLTLSGNGINLATSSGSTQRITALSGIIDSATAVAYEFDTVNALTTSGARHTKWKNNGVDVMRLTQLPGVVLEVLGGIQSNSVSLGASIQNSIVFTGAGNTRIGYTAGSGGHLFAATLGYPHTPELVTVQGDIKATIGVAATVGTPLINSPFLVLPASYWNGASATSTTVTLRHVADTSPAGDTHLAVVFDGTEVLEIRDDGIVRNPTDTLQLQGSPTDSASAVGFEFDTVNTLSTVGAKLISLKNNTVEKFAIDKDGTLLLTPALVTLVPTSPGVFDMGFNNIATVRLNSNGLFTLKAASVGTLNLGLATELDNNAEITSIRGGTAAFGFRTNTAGTSSVGVGFRFQSVNNTSLWDDVDAAFVSIEPAVTGALTGRQVWKMNGFGDTYWIAVDAVDNAVVDSPDLILRANYDADAGAGITPTAFDALVRHNMLTAGAAPTSQLDFLVNGANRLSLPSAAPAVYTRNATIVTDRTLLASASATTINNNNVLAALIEDLKARNLIG